MLGKKKKPYFLKLELPVVFTYENGSLMFFIRKYLEWFEKKKKKCEGVKFNFVRKVKTFPSQS